MFVLISPIEEKVKPHSMVHNVLDEQNAEVSEKPYASSDRTENRKVLTRVCYLRAAIGIHDLERVIFSARNSLWLPINCCRR